MADTVAMPAGMFVSPAAAWELANVIQLRALIETSWRASGRRQLPPRTAEMLDQLEINAAWYQPANSQVVERPIGHDGRPGEMPERILVPAAEAARLLDRCGRTVRRLLEQRDLTGVMRGGRRFVHLDSIREVLNQREEVST